MSGGRFVDADHSTTAYEHGATAVIGASFLESLRGSTVCVVGCTGVIGRSLLDILVRTNENFHSDRIRIIGVARTINSDTLPMADGLTYLEGAADSPQCIQLASDADYVVYVAGTTSDYRSKPLATIESQTANLHGILTAASQCSGFLFVSSARVYGRHLPDYPVAEDYAGPVEPMSLDNIYDCAKRLGESICLWHQINNGTASTVVRLTNVYGRNERIGSRTMVNDFILQARSKSEIHLAGHPDSVRNHISELDAAQGILRALVKGRRGHAYNIGSRDHLTTATVASLVAGAMRFPVAVLGPPSPLPPANRQMVSIEKAETELQYSPVHRFAELVPDLVNTTQSCSKQS
jgi:UDP-glucuronate decarboxylase